MLIMQAVDEALIAERDAGWLPPHQTRKLFCLIRVRLVRPTRLAVSAF